MLIRLTISTLLASLTLLAACSSDNPRTPTAGGTDPAPKGSTNPDGTSSFAKEPPGSTGEHGADGEIPPY